MSALLGSLSCAAKAMESRASRVVAGSIQPLEMALTPEALYWIDEAGGSGPHWPGRLMRLPRNSSTPVTLKTDFLPGSLAASPRGVAYTDLVGPSPGKATLHFVAADGSTKELAHEAYSQSTLLIVGPDLLWMDAEGSLMETSLESGIGHAITSTAAPIGNEWVMLASDGMSLFWFNGTSLSIYRTLISTTSGPDLLQDVGSTPVAFAASSQYVYWIDAGGGFKYLSTNKMQSPAPVALNVIHPKGVAQDNDTVCWTAWGDGEQTGTMSCSSPESSKVQQVADKQQFPAAIAMDATEIYWGAEDGIWRASR